MQRVLIVEDSFSIAKRGVVVLPSVPLQFFEGKQLSRLVELRLPDGSTIEAAADFAIPRRTPPITEYEVVCHLPNLKRAVPVGTEVWADLKATEG